MADAASRSPLKTRTKIALSVFALVVLAGVLGFLMVLKHGFSARDEPTAVEAFFARRVRRLAVPRAAREMTNPVKLNEEALSEARAHFADHCASCHGNDGRGQTKIGQNLYPRVPDMASSKTQSLSDGELFYVIKHGIRLTGMPAWGEDTPEDDRESWKLVHFIQHLPDITPEEIEEMTELNPKTRAEFKEEDAIRRFLEGGEAPRPDEDREHKH